MATAARVTDVTKTFGDTVALDRVDLRLTEGQVLALLGPNGAGKTTLVKILATLLVPERGRAEVFGHDVVAEAPAVRRLVALTGQFAAVDELLTGRENLRMFGRLFHLQPEETSRRADELLERFELTDAGDRPVRTYSGGMRRRLDLASSLITRPRLLFLDEPTTGFDPEARRQFWALIRSLRDLGTTMLLTTHYLDEAEALADRVGVIAQGRLAQVAVPALLGDRETAPAVVSWTEDGVRRTAETTTPTAFVRELAARFPGEVPDLAVNRPTLEDVYLKMIGDNS